MTARLRYLIRRMREAPLSVTIEKISGRIRPWFFYPSYKFAGTPKPSDAMLEGFRAFGAHLREHLTLPESTSLADRVLAGGFDVLGYGTADIPSGKEWHADAFHGVEWPLDYFARIDYAAMDTRGDVKVPWEISRLQFLPWLAEAYLLSESEKYLDSYRRVVDDWLDNNPVAHGVNWSCPMEVAIRAVNLGASAALLGDALDVQRQRRIVASLAAHLRFIDRFPETSDVNGNHYLADLMGACFIAAMLYGRDSADTVDRIYAFASEAHAQFEEEGAHLERAPVYHRLCLDMVCVVSALVPWVTDELSCHLAGTAKRARQFARDLSSKGLLPVIGDSDSGQILWFGEHPRSMTTAECFLSATVPESPSGQLRWLNAISGSDGPGMWHDLDPSAGAGLASGFAYARSGDTLAVMRAGEQGLKGIASHDHDDALSLWISMAGSDLIVEAGCHSYTLSGEERRRYIVSSAHNVIRPANGERFEPVQGSVFQNVRGAPIPESVTYDAKACRIDAELEPGVFRRCARGVSVEEQCVRIQDRWEWAAPQATAVVWPLAPQVKANVDAQNVVRLTREDGLEATMSFSCESEFDIEIGEHEFSPVYGGSETAAAVHVAIRDDAAGELTTEIAVA